MIRAALARIGRGQGVKSSVIRERRALGLTQQELAALAGVRQETLSRIENARHLASPATIDKIDRALRTAERKRR